MAIEDFLHPLLGAYIDSPQWVKASVGRVYSWLPVTLRRGSHYKHFVGEANISDPVLLEHLVSRKLAATLRWALETVPAYRQYQHLLPQLGQPQGQSPGQPHAVLAQLPLLTKLEIKQDLSRYLSLAMPAKRRLTTFTGGSTDSAMKFYLHKGYSRPKEYAFMENFHQRVAMDANALVLALRGRSVPSAQHPGGRLWMVEPIKRHLILSSDHLVRANMPQYVAALRLWKPQFIQAFPSALYPLARWLRDHPAPDVTNAIKGIMLYSENVYANQMALLHEVFSCPVLHHYGHSERVLMAASMPDDARYFFWPHYGHFELVDERGNPVTKPGMLGEIVGTSFDNQVMPFIRYRTGDMAIMGERPHPLLPGYPVVERIEGRWQEFLVCHDGRLISICTMGTAHSGDLTEVDAMQYEQYVRGHFVLRVVSPRPLMPTVRERILHAVIAKTQGGCSAELVEVRDIPRTGRGKHQMLIQHLDLTGYFGSALSL
jgi:phenylacetate-CoA ligase